MGVNVAKKTTMKKREKSLPELIKAYKKNHKLTRVDTNIGRCYTPDVMDQSTWKPSVTTMENIISKGIMFERWIANFGGYDKVCDYVGKKADDGTLVHEYIEDLLNKGKVDLPKDTEEHIKKYMQSFIEWYNEADIIPVELELQLYHKDVPFSGTADLVGYLDGKLVMIDWKTGNEYPTNHQIQLSCYMYLFNTLFPKYQVKEIYCLYVKSGWRKKPTFKLREYKYDSLIYKALTYLFNFNLAANKTKVASKVGKVLPNTYKIKRRK